MDPKQANAGVLSGTDRVYSSGRCFCFHGVDFCISAESIVSLGVDAIVNAANASLLGGGGIDGAIHAAAGRGLLDECMRLGGCREGEAKTTGGYDTGAQYIIHTVGPYGDKGHESDNILCNCYNNCLMEASRLGLQSIAFSGIGCGIYGYPLERGRKMAVMTCMRFILQNPKSTVKTILFVQYNKRELVYYHHLFDEVIALAAQPGMTENELPSHVRKIADPARQSQQQSFLKRHFISESSPASTTPAQSPVSPATPAQERGVSTAHPQTITPSPPPRPPTPQSTQKAQLENSGSPSEAPHKLDLPDKFAIGSDTNVLDKNSKKDTKESDFTGVLLGGGSSDSKDGDEDGLNGKNLSIKRDAQTATTTISDSQTGVEESKESFRDESKLPSPPDAAAQQTNGCKTAGSGGGTHKLFTVSGPQPSPTGPSPT